MKPWFGKKTKEMALLFLELRRIELLRSVDGHLNDLKDLCARGDEAGLAVPRP
jgi:hypothetical protein